MTRMPPPSLLAALALLCAHAPDASAQVINCASVCAGNVLTIAGAATVDPAAACGVVGNTVALGALDSASGCPVTYCGVNSATLNFDLPGANYGVVNLNGFQCAGGTLRVSSPTVTRFTAPNLSAVGDDIEVVANSGLGRFSAPILTQLGTGGIDNDLRFVSNPSLSLINLPTLTQIFGSLTLSDHTNLLGLPNFAGLVNVAGDILIGDNGRLNVDAALSALTQIGGSLTITDNPFTVALNLSALQAVAGPSLLLESNAISNLNLSSLSQANTVMISGERNLTTLGPQWPLIALGGSLVLDGNGLQNLASLSNLQTVADDIQIIGNSSLTTIAGVSGVIGVGGKILVETNISLPTVRFPLVPTLQSVVIRSNYSLTQLGFSSLTTITNGFLIYQNNQLPGIGGTTGVIGFPSLTTTPTLKSEVSLNPAMTTVAFPALVDVWDLEIADNAAMTTMQFPALTDVHHDLVIRNNDAWNDANDFSALFTVGRDIVLKGNDVVTAVNFPSLDSFPGMLRAPNNIAPDWNPALGAVTAPLLDCTQVSIGACGGTGSGPGADPLKQSLIVIDACVADGIVPDGC